MSTAGTEVASARAEIGVWGSSVEIDCDQIVRIASDMGTELALTTGEARDLRDYLNEQLA